MSEEIERLVQAIDDRPDPLHGDRTPAVEALIDRGLAVLPYLLPLLESGGDQTRLRAQRVLEGITHQWVRERTAARPLTRDDTHEWNRLWQANGGYDWSAPQAARAAAVKLWSAWLDQQGAPPRDG